MWEALIGIVAGAISGTGMGGRNHAYTVSYDVFAEWNSMLRRVQT